MKTEHTPGPWFLDSAPDVDLPNHVGISSDKHDLLAQVVWKMEDDERTPMCEANASLIAAAPDLLAAAYRAASALESVSYYDPSITSALAVARAAIAKATGEKQ